MPKLTLLERVLERANLQRALEQVRSSQGAPGIDGMQLRLRWKLQGHFAYFGISSNIERLQALHRAAYRLWRKWLARRHRGPRMPWERLPLPTPRIFHRYT